MRVHYLQHVSFEDLGNIEPWLQQRGASISCTRLFESAPLPAVGEFDFLIVMGGPMSVNDEETWPWLRDEQAIIRDAIEAGKAILGVCLGAQLIANTLGQPVFPNRCKEIGWFPAEGVPAEGDAFQFPDELHVFQWHGETFGLPDGARQLARSEGCENQAFQFGPAVIALQFHLETTPESAQGMVTHCGDELVTGEFIQAADEILAAPPERYAAARGVMAAVLAYLAQAAVPARSSQP